MGSVGSVILPILRALADELDAEAVVVSRNGRLIAQASRLSANEVARLIQMAVDSWYASTLVAQVLKREQRHFEQSIEGGEYVFYSLAVSDGLILSVALGYGIALGLLRHRARMAAGEIRTVIAKEGYGPEENPGSN
jgi:predicted regulator of Ras-like GTPase activity (Roadblock/LC7/MglB family)